MERGKLWAPWRIKYVQDTGSGGECFVCHNLKNPQDDDKNLVLWRTANCVVILNRFPYNNGHTLIAPNRHIGGLEDATEEELLEMMKAIREVRKALCMTIKPHGFNVGINLGKCAGAGLPGHLHIHVVPRWDGDTNFMKTCSDTDVISQSLEELLGLLRQVSKDNNLPKL